MVQARTWPGINKHGGVGRVTKVHSSTGIGGSAVQYDVSYVLGGKEKFVDESFVQLHKTSEEESPTTVASARKPRKSSEKKMESRRPKRIQQKVTFKEEVRIYDEEELKHIPAEALEWAGIVPKKGKGKKKATGKKRALADSNSNTNPAGSSTKKQKASPVSAAASKVPSNSKKTEKPKKEKTVAEAESSVVEALMAMAHDSGTADLNEIISPLSTQELVQCADERYSSLLCTSGDSEVSLVLNVVTSNLSNAESDSLNSLCKILKDKNGENKFCCVKRLLSTLNSILISIPSALLPCIRSLLEAYEKFQGKQDASVYHFSFRREAIKACKRGVECTNNEGDAIHLGGIANSLPSVGGCLFKRG